MSKRANAGELRTRIQIKRRNVVTNDNGFDDDVTYENVYSDGQYVYCKWVGNHGSEVFSRDSYAERRTATVTMRYSPLADDGKLVVFLYGDPDPWEVVKVDNWGLKNLAYRIKKNRKGYYVLLDIVAPAKAIAEYERRVRLNEDVIRYMTVRVNEFNNEMASDEEVAAAVEEA